MTDHLIGKKGDYATFSEVIPHLQTGDIVTFKPGLHTIKTTNLTINKLTLRGIADNAYEKTTLVITPETDRPNQPAFSLAEGGGLEIDRLSIVVSPNVTPIVCDEQSVLLIKQSNLVWNHFKLQNLDDNLPLIATISNTTVMHTVDIIDSVISSLDIVAKTLNLDNTVIGSPYGAPSYISGFTSNSSANFIINTDLALVGEMYSLNVLGDCQIVDTNETLCQKFPNLENLPLTITNLLFNRFDPKAVRVGNTWDKIAEGLYKKRVKLAPKLITTYLTNARKQTPLYVTIEPKGRGKKYPIPHDKSLLDNQGLMIITGENNAQTTWPNTQTSGMLVLNHYSSKIPYDYVGGDLITIDSDVSASKNAPLKSTGTTYSGELNPPRLTEDYITKALLTPKEILMEKAKHTYIFDNLMETFEHFAMADKINQLPIVLVSSDNFPKVVLEIDKFSKVLHAKQVLAFDKVKQISRETMASDKPTDYKDFFLDGLGGTWLHNGVSALIENEFGAMWVTFAERIQNLAAPQPPTLIVYVDTKDGIDKFQAKFKLKHAHRFDAPN